MSGFVKRTKAVDTANPAGGIDPAKSPNVGQFGWTSYDASNVNQIIEYVDLCKKYAEAASQSSEYIEGKIVELNAFMKYVENAYEEIKPIYDDIIPMYADIISRHEDIKVRHEDIIAKHGEVKDWHHEAGVFAEESESHAAKALTSQLLAGQSEQGAEGWYDKSYELYEELQKGNVYRGTWSPHTLAYPDNGGTNSTWDVILNEGELEYVWNGTRWFWGDRLVYVKTTNIYQQIESGTTVNSVNGKKGAVVLNADDVKAVPITRTVNGKVLSADISITSTDTNSVPTTRRVNNKVLDSDVVLIHSDVQAVPLDRKVNNKFLSADITLNADDVGALSLGGGTLTGNLTISDDKNLIMQANEGGSTGDIIFGSSPQQGRIWSPNPTTFALSSDGSGSTIGDGVFVISNSNTLRLAGKKVYSEFEKPTTADVTGLEEALKTANDKISELESWPQSGSNANGSWIKYRDGTMIVTAVKKGYGVSIIDSAGVLFQSNVVVNIPFPITFDGVPVCTHSVEYISGGIRPIPVPVSQNSTSASLVIQSGASSSSAICDYYVQAIGRWK